MNFRVLIIDDEPLARLGVATRLQQYPDMNVIGECTTGEQALALIPELLPDLIFLDIEMPGISGLELIPLLAMESSPRVVFLTAHEEYALNAFEVEALDYLLKPIEDARFAASVDRARRVLALHRQESRYERLHQQLTAIHKEKDCIRRFAVRRGNEVVFVNAANVDWIEGMGDYAGLHVGNKTHLIRDTLSSLESRLDRTQFLRIHRSTIVQVDRIARVAPLANRDALVTLRDSTSLRASRTHCGRLRDLLRNFPLYE
jgi:two-component system LytT family response regulator